MAAMLNQINPDGRYRVIELDNNKIHFRAKDPYGHWFVNFDKGQIPDSLKSAFTSFYEAEKRVLAYLREKNRPVTAKG
jgi:hypothetical protein